VTTFPLSSARQIVAASLSAAQVPGQATLVATTDAQLHLDITKILFEAFHLGRVRMRISELFLSLQIVRVHF
jgi:hypothetical protein